MAAEQFADRRVALRQPARLAFAAFGPDARRRELAIVDLSPHGVAAESETMAPGDRLRLVLPGEGVMGATVRWCAAGRIGCRFDRAIEPAGYYELLAALLTPT